jgi:hypothetical protein
MTSTQVFSEQRGLSAFTDTGRAKQDEPVGQLLNSGLNLARRVATFEPGRSIRFLSHKWRFAELRQPCRSRIYRFGELRAAEQSPLTPAATMSERFDQDTLGDLRAEREPGVTDQANNVGVGGEKSHDLVFTEAKLPQTPGNLGGGTKLFNADGYAGFDAVERAEGVFAIGTRLTGCRSALVLHTVRS